MREVVDLILAVVFSGSFLLGTGYTIKEVHDFVKKECVEQIAQGLSSSEELANALTSEKLDFWFEYPS